MKSERLNKEGVSVPSKNKPEYSHWPVVCAYGTAEDWESSLVVARNIGRPTQVQLDKLFSTYPLEEGLFVVPINYTPDSALLGKTDINFILKIEKDAEKVEYSTSISSCRPILLATLPKWSNKNLQKGTEIPDSWIRWGHLDLYRKLTSQEFDRLVKPDYDFLQDYIAQIRFGLETGSLKVFARTT